YLTLQTELNSEQRKNLENISYTAKSLLRIINDILDISKIEAGKIEIENIEFSIDRMVENVSSIISVKSKEKDIEFITHISSDVPNMLIGDSYRIEQILINLLNNSVKFTEKGEIKLSITLETETEKNASVKFEISDTGIGMNNEQLDKMMLPFMQADSSTTRKYGGTGLGMTISNQLIKLLNGKLTVNSAQGKGTVFSFILTFNKGSKINIKSQGAFKNKKAMVIDDNHTALKIMREILQSFSVDTTLASSGKSGIEELTAAIEKGVSYDIVFIDWKMPSMDGIETIRKINEILKDDKRPAIVMFSAYNKDKLTNEAKGLGIKDFIVKPVNRSIIFDSMSKIFSKELSGAALKYTGRGNLFDPVFMNKNFLLVDDNEINLEIIIKLLISFGCRNENITAAKNGVTGLNIAMDNKFDCVLLDIHMPLMNGYQVAEKLKENEYYKNIPVIAMTADASESDKIKCLNAGMCDHIAKPIIPELLKDTLIKNLNKNRQEKYEK
ncbi:response regulator, partial [Candidatus Dependentiae bacterium]|nr:response regulator [Candidatus Dependentiae bacterium]